MEKAVGSQDFSQLFSQVKSIRYKKGGIILRPDDVLQNINYIEKGFVKVYSINESGDEKLHIIYKAGELFPVVWVFRHLNKDVFYEALSEVVIRKLPKRKFIEIVRQNLSLSNRLLDFITDILAVHIDRVDNLEFTSSYSRLISRLLFLAKRFGQKEGGKIVIDAPITHQEIANSINMTRETTSRELELLHKRGLVDYQKRRLVIKNLNKLREELNLHHHKQSL